MMIFIALPDNRRNLKKKNRVRKPVIGVVDSRDREIGRVQGRVLGRDKIFFCPLACSRRLSAVP